MGYYVYIEFLDGQTEKLDFGDNYMGAFRKHGELLQNKKFLKQVRFMQVKGDGIL